MKLVVNHNFLVTGGVLAFTLIYLYFIVQYESSTFFFYPIFVFLGQFRRCNCLPQQNCQSYSQLMQTLQRPFTFEVLQYLGQMQCGYKKNIPMVCCNDPVGTSSSRNAKSK